MIPNDCLHRLDQALPVFYTQGIRLFQKHFNFTQDFRISYVIIYMKVNSNKSANNATQIPHQSGKKI